MWKLTANQTFMLWSPNIWAGAVDDKTQGYVPFFPGEECESFSGFQI